MCLFKVGVSFPYLSVLSVCYFDVGINIGLYCNIDTVLVFLDFAVSA